MYKLLQQISEIPRVNGSERRIAQFLHRHFVAKGFHVQTLPGNHVFVKMKDSSPRTVVFTPMDTPGFVCLYKEDGVGYLASTSKVIGELKDFDSVVNANGDVFQIQESKYDKKSFCIKSERVQIGENFSIPSKPEVNENQIAGRFSAGIACICLLIKLADLLENPSVALCFTSGSHSGMKAEANVMKRTGATNAILLNPAEFDENTDAPILAIKDGKHFSSKNLSEHFLAACAVKDIAVRKVVFDQGISAAERTYAPHVSEILSLALPCSRLYQAEEKTIATENMLFALTHFLNSRTV